MADGSHDRNLLIVDDGAVSGLARWAPIVVVLSVVIGFATLSWYAYHAGMQSVKDDDLLVVEADKTPLKEKPLDPGGMKFPNQDKTIFDTFAGNQQQPGKVERVLPKPEEPISKDSTDSGTDTWVNDKLQKHDQEPAAIDGKEKMIGAEASIAKSKDYAQIKEQYAVDHPSNTAGVVADQDQSETYVAHKDPEKTVEAPKSPAVVAVKPVEKVPEEKKPVPKAVSTGAAAIQLGAYRSEKEAMEAWTKMHIKFSELSDKSPLVVKADLGSKGIYYRLRVGSLAASDAKATCKALSGKGQACLVPTDK